MKKIELNKDDAVRILKTIFDPELGVDIYSLGLVYEIKIEKGNSINVKMTLTTPFCPYGPTIVESVENGLIHAGFINPKIELVFDPPWVPTEEVKMMLGFG